MTTSTPSRLFDFLPAAYREGEGKFFGALLGAFESVLLENAGATGEDRGLDQVVADIHCNFDPKTAPTKDFLNWLAGWVAFTLDAELDLEKKREFLGKIVSLYPWRGTRKNLQSVLVLFTSDIGAAAGTAVVTEYPPFDAQLDVHSTLDKDFFLDGPPPYSFTVTLFLHATPAERVRQTQIVRALIEAEKPAHTMCRLILVAKGFLLGQAKLGVDTTLGTFAPN